MTAEDLTHILTHVERTGGGSADDRRLIPVCTCGWYSIVGSHWQFEQRHISDVINRYEQD